MVTRMVDALGLAADVGDVVRRELDRARIAPHAAARAVGIPYTTLHRSLNGGRPLDVAELAALGSLIGMTPRAILARAEGAEVAA